MLRQHPSSVCVVGDTIGIRRLCKSSANVIVNASLSRFWWRVNIGCSNLRLVDRDEHVWQLASDGPASVQLSIHLPPPTSHLPPPSSPSLSLFHASLLSTMIGCLEQHREMLASAHYHVHKPSAKRAMRIPLSARSQYFFASMTIVGGQNTVLDFKEEKSRGVN